MSDGSAIRKRGVHTGIPSPRQIDVLRCIADGMQGAEICRTLGISDGTFRAHRSWLYLKLGAHSAVEAVMEGIKLGIIDPKKPVQFAKRTAA